MSIVFYKRELDKAIKKLQEISKLLELERQKNNAQSKLSNRKKKR